MLLAVLVLALAIVGGLGLCRLAGFGPRDIKVIEREGPTYQLEHHGVATLAVPHNDHARLSFDRCTSNNFPWGPRSDYDEVAWSPNGSVVYLTDGGRILAVTADGWRLRQVADARPPNVDSALPMVGTWTSFAVAPDGHHLVYVGCRPWPDGTSHSYDLFGVTRDGATASQLTDNSLVEFYPAWSPDGRRIAFLSDAGWSELESPAEPRSMGLYTMAADGSDIRPVLGDDFAVLHQPPQWSPDGRHLAVVRYVYKEVRRGFAVNFEEIGRELYVVRPDGAKRWRVATDVVSAPSWSPDGQRLAFAQAEVSGVALHTVGMAETNSLRITDIPQWRAPRRSGVPADEDPTEAWIDTVAWSPDGTRILVRSNSDHPAFVVSLATGHTRRIGFADPPSPDGLLEGLRAVAWSPDGARIALLARGRFVEGPGVVATVAADGTDLRVLAERENPVYSDSKLLAQRARYVPGPEDEAACRTGGAVPNPDVNEWLVEQCVDLIRVRKSLVGGEALNWNPERPMAEWHGVILGGEPPYVGVRELDLGGRGLRGALRESIPWRPALRVLVLRDNNLDGPIPDGSLNQWDLEVIDLSNNQLTGPIPFRMGGLDRLRILDLSSNQLSGEIPARLAELPNLQEIALAGNQFTGCVPPGLPVRDRDELDLPTCEPGT